METPWGREVRTHPCVHPHMHLFFPSLFNESPDAGPAWALTCKIRGSSPLSRGAHSSKGRPSLSKGTREGLVPGLGPCIPGQLRMQEHLAPHRPERSTRLPLKNPPGFTLTPHHLPLVQGREGGCGQCPFSPPPTTRPLPGGLQPWRLSRGWLYKELSPGAGTKSKNPP